jgi:tryptophanase
MAATAGLFEIVKEAYLHNRVTQVEMFAQQLQASGIAVLSPPGGHAVFLDMDDLFRGCNRKPDDYASVGFTLELIRAYGVRAVEAGHFGWEWDKKSPEERIKIPNLVRFSVPRHVMSDQHINYTVAAIKKLHDQRHKIPNVIITRGKNMRLRHFSCGLKPAPVAPNIKSTYLEEATYQLSQLSEAVEQDPVAMKQILSAMALTAGKWGQMPIPKEADLSGQVWLSGVSNDHSPFEYSLVIAQSTGKTELRFMVEAQPVKNNLACAGMEALALNELIEKEYGEKVSFGRFNTLRDLFIPSHFDGQGKLGAWHSCAMSETGPEWKIYLNPQVSGIEKAMAVAREAFERLSILDAWRLLESTMSSIDSILYFSLDLSPYEGDARVKVYVTHTGVTAADIAAKHSKICPGSDSYEIQRFLRTMAGGSRGPYQGKEVLSCFAFTSGSPECPVGTVHFPMDAYVLNDEEAKSRIEQYFTESGSGVLPVCRERYLKALYAVQRRPLAQGSGIHAWVSLKIKPGGALVNTFYFSPELFWYGAVH